MSVEIVTNAQPLTITESALKEIKRILSEEERDGNKGIRIGVKGGGCSGFSYVFDFDEEDEKDAVYDIDDVKVIMKKSHAIYLFGIEIDYKNDLGNTGFIFTNPNATDTCGCGSSFSA